jgi:hypothetical protein
MLSPEEYVQLLQRITVLETKLAALIQSLEVLVRSVDNRHREIMSIYEGDNVTPNLTARLITLERLASTLKWSLGVLYTAVVGLIVSFIKEKL